MSNPPCHTWLGRLANLNAARTAARGIAPHKPLMLLTVIDLIESGDIPDGWVKFDVRLVSRFRDYWELVLERQRNQRDIPMPFHALGGERDQIWERYTEDGQPSRAKATTRLCSLDPDLFACLQDAGFRRKARQTLDSLYFTAKEQVMLCARLGLPVPKTAEIDALREQADEFKARQKKGRDSRFKSDVLGGYYFTCALTGYRLDTESTSIVQAAHIHQHAVSGNDAPRNGLALTPDAHWMFDQGLWTAVPKGDHIVVSPFGVFVIETKNDKGWIYGDEKQHQWTQQIYRKKSRIQMPNPKIEACASGLFHGFLGFKVAISIKIYQIWPLIKPHQTGSRW